MRNLHTVFCSSCTNLHSYQGVWGFPFLHILTNFLIAYFLFLNFLIYFLFFNFPLHCESFPKSMRETWVRSVGLEDPLEKEMAAHSSILAWRIPGMEEPGRLQSTWLQRVGHNGAISLYFTSRCESLPKSLMTWF